MHYSTVEYSTVQYSNVQYSTVQYSKYSTVQYSTVEFSKIEYSTNLHTNSTQNPINLGGVQAMPSPFHDTFHVLLLIVEYWIN